MTPSRAARPRPFNERLHELQEAQAADVIRDLLCYARLRLGPMALPMTATFSYTPTAPGATPIWECLKTTKDQRFKDIVRTWRCFGPGTLISTERRNGTTRFIGSWTADKAAERSTQRLA